MPNLAQPNLCTGCTACAAICPKDCIAMMADENGFLCPVIDADKCVACGLCERSCPVMTPLEKAENEPKAYAAYSKDESMRLESSSGGVFTEVAKAVLARGGAVFGAAYNERFEVVHICVECEADLAKLRGAKYAQSDLRGVFTQMKQRLDEGTEVLFSGTPCQVGGLKAFLRKEYENLITVDFVCHSVPSPMAWREYVKYRAEQDNGGRLPEAVNLRAKETGWSRYQYSSRFEYTDGCAHVAKSGESLYMKLFVGNYINRESCADCQFKGYSRVSDLTIGDFWGIWDIAPEMDDNKGTSVVLCQSDRGREMLDVLADRLVLKQVSLEEASYENGAMLNASPINPKREEALELIRSGRISECADWFKPPKPSLKQKLRRVVKKLMGR